MKRVCVFCGSRPGRRAAYREASESLGSELVRRGLGLVFGGGRVGLMGIVADAVLAAGGEVVGVIPRALMEREVGHEGIPDLRVVGSMHERKALMAELADGFVALPGGLGTLEEVFEITTWAQLGVHRKPVGLLNVDGYYDHLLSALDHAVDEGFLRQPTRRALLVQPGPAALLDELERFTPADVPAWIDRGQT